MASVDQTRTWPSVANAHQYMQEEKEEYRTSSRRDQSTAIRGDMTAIDLEILLLPAMRKPYRSNVAHGRNF